MKQKILFYGNCHTWTLGRYFLRNPELQEKFEVIGADESCKPMGRNPVNFKVWAKSNRLHQSEFFNAIHEKIKQADIFVFQDMGLSSCIPELTTKFLCDKIVTGKAICVPNPRLTMHSFDLQQSNPYIKYAQTKVNDPNNVEEIVEFLRMSDDPKLTEILEQEYPISNVRIEGRNENHQRAKLHSQQYPNYICMESFIKENFKTKVVAFEAMHPTKIYFVELMKLLLTNIGLVDSNVNEEYITLQGVQSAAINPMQFKFFREYFPLLHDEFQKNCLNKDLVQKIRKMTSLV